MTPKLSEDVKRAIMVFIMATIVFTMLAYVAITPRPREQFFQIYVLGETGMAERYYPENNSDIIVGRVVKWYVGTTNFMGSVQYVVIKVKLANSTIKAPDDVNHVPSPAPVLLEFRKVLTNNDTWEFPFTWVMKEVVGDRGDISPTILEINNVKIRNSHVSAIRGYNLRIVFELWTYDPQSDSFVFGWRTSAEQRVAWLQIWFNATRPGTSL